LLKETTGTFSGAQTHNLHILRRAINCVEYEDLLLVENVQLYPTLSTSKFKRLVNLRYHIPRFD